MEVMIGGDHTHGGRSPSSSASAEPPLSDMRLRVGLPLRAWERASKSHQLQRDLIIDSDFDGGLEEEFASFLVRRRAEPGS